LARLKLRWRRLSKHFCFSVRLGTKRSAINACSARNRYDKLYDRIFVVLKQDMRRLPRENAQHFKKKLMGRHRSTQPKSTLTVVMQTRRPAKAN
jgi:hypothetical protein